MGESGSGKSVSALSLLGLLPTGISRVTSGTAMFEGEDLLRLPEGRLRSIRGNRIGLISQDPLSSLNPMMTIGRQIAEALEIHLDMSRTAATARAVELLDLVGIPSPARRINDYPHQFSGGMRQRAMIAMALSCEPSLLIADEPTTALDVTIQAQVLELLQRLREELHMAVLLITHDLAVLAGFADRLAVMYAGRVVETGPTEQILADPVHPYTIGLLGSLPRLDRDRGVPLTPIEGVPPDLAAPLVGCPFRPRCPYAVEACTSVDPDLEPAGPERAAACHSPQGSVSGGASVMSASRAGTGAGLPAPSSPSDTALLSVDGLRIWFPVREGMLRRRVGWLYAVDGVSFSIARGKTLGLVGESGSGKSTVGRAIMRINTPRAGTITLHGENLLELKGRDLRRRRRRFQMVSQDPYSSLDPRQKVGSILAEPLDIHDLATGADRNERVEELLRLVGLDPDFVDRYPREFSGGQRQRIGIARALAVEPDLIVLDEPVSALDVSIQAQTINLLERLQDELGLTYLFISHDLSVVRHIADQVAVMYLGKLVEVAPSEALYLRPLHPYTTALLSAVPVPDAQVERTRKRIVLTGDIPSPSQPPPGCRFHTRCWLRERLGDPELCATTEPPLAEPLLEAVGVGSGRLVACHYARELSEVIKPGATLPTVDVASPESRAPR